MVMTSQGLGATVTEVPEPGRTHVEKYLGECASGLFSRGDLEMFLLPQLYSGVAMGHLVMDCGLHRGLRLVERDVTSSGVYAYMECSLFGSLMCCTANSEGEPACMLLVLLIVDSQYFSLLTISHKPNPMC